MSLLAILDSNKTFGAKEAQDALDEMIVTAVLGLEQTVGGEDTIAPDAIYALIEARTAITDDSIEEERDGFKDDVIEPGKGHAEYRQAIKQAYIDLTDGMFGKTEEEVENYMEGTFIPEMNFSKVSISLNLLKRIADAVVTREESVVKALRKYASEHA